MRLRYQKLTAQEDPYNDIFLPRRIHESTSISKNIQEFKIIAQQDRWIAIYRPGGSWDCQYLSKKICTVTWQLFIVKRIR